MAIPYVSHRFTLFLAFLESLLVWCCLVCVLDLCFCVELIHWLNTSEQLSIICQGRSSTASVISSGTAADVSLGVSEVASALAAWKETSNSETQTVALRRQFHHPRPAAH